MRRFALFLWPLLAIQLILPPVLPAAVPVVTPEVTYTATGSATSYAYLFRIFAATDLVVSVGGVQKTLGTHYSVTGVNNPAGGTVVFVTAPAAGAQVKIVRATPLDRTTDYTTGGPLRAATLNADIDRVVTQIQDLDKGRRENQLAVARALKFPVGDATDPTLPPVATRAGKMLGFDPAGVPSMVSNLIGTFQADVTVENIATLRALPATHPANTIAIVLGYYSAGDGGGGAFIWKSEGAPGTYAENGGTVIVPNGGDGGAAWVRNYSGAVDVRWFGAVPNDGADDTAAIKAASTTGENVEVQCGIYIMSDTLNLNIGQSLTGGGSSVATIAFTGMAGKDGISFVSAGGYNRASTVSGLTISAASGVGNAGIRTPEGAVVFSNVRAKYLFSDLVFVDGEDPSLTVLNNGWKKAIQVGDTRGAVFEKLTVYGLFNPTQDPTLQPAESTGIYAAAVTGAIGLNFRDCEFRNLRDGVYFGDGVEGFVLSKSEFVGVWRGINCSNSIVEPGGFISDLHINANHRGIYLKNRSELNISNVSIYRSGAFYDHASTWIGIEIINCLYRINISNYNCVPNSTAVAATRREGIAIVDSDGVNLSNIALYSDLLRGLYLDGCQNIIVNGLLVSNINTLSEITGTNRAAAYIHIGPYTVRGSVVNHLVFGSNYDQASIKIDRQQMMLGNNSTINVSAAGTTYLEAPTSAQLTQVNVGGATAYTYQIRLKSTGAVRGDVLVVKVIMPSDLNPALEIWDEASNVKRNRFNATGLKRFRCEYMYNGSGWVTNSVTEDVDTAHR